MCLPLYCLHRARQCKVGSPEWRRRQVPSELARLAEYPVSTQSTGSAKWAPPSGAAARYRRSLTRLAEYPCESLSLGQSRVPLEYP
jgi:hypothetical protein